MTLSSPPSSTSHNDKTCRLTRRVSSLSPLDNDSESSEGSRSLKRPRLDERKLGLTRQVSNEGFTFLRNEEILQVEDVEEKISGSQISLGSPIRCVSDFDKVTSHDGSVNGIDVVESKSCPLSSLYSIQESTTDYEGAPTRVSSIPNPVHNESILEQHKEALRLEAELNPMRLILSRIMAHHVLNRKGLFNKPVDPVALGIPDYFTIVKRPMDFGTIKERLHSNTYKSVIDVTEDMRLVFLNAMTYNPPGNVVHVNAKDLLYFFEDQLLAFLPEQAQPPENTLRMIPTRAAPSSSGSSGKIFALDANAVPSSVSNVSLECSECLSLPTTDGVSISAAGKKRMKRGSKKAVKDHHCQWCRGMNCSLCGQGCLSLEPTLLICNGANCAGAKIRKGAIYYISPEGNCQYCQRCYTGLPAVLPQHSTPSGAQIEHDHDDSTRSCRYKRNLLKRKNDEEVVEEWMTCCRCESAVHKMCAMYNKLSGAPDEFICPDCVTSSENKRVSFSLETTPSDVEADEMYTFLTGSDTPVKLSDFSCNQFNNAENVFSAESLPQTEIASFIERKVRDCIGTSCSHHEEKTVTVRIISDIDKSFKVPDVIRKHFKMQRQRHTLEEGGNIIPPAAVQYRSKAITLFQKVDGLDVCIFCMYVHEYGDDVSSDQDQCNVSRQKRIYIAYLDSVEHLRPRQCRTKVYHEVLVAYLATARARGFESAHIWACPPSRGNSFVFWNHPSSQRTPTMERLLAWYHGAIARAVDRGVVSDVMSLYESDFEEHFKSLEQGHDGLQAHQLSDSVSGLMVCPPLLEGDFWVEEAVRVHGIHMNRQLKPRSGTTPDFEKGNLSDDQFNDPCPALQLASMIRDKILAHPSSLAFRRPVNAAAMKLKDYHKIIQRPMDLGTVFSKTVLGEYRNLSELVEDVNLVFSNAKKYNPPGNIVHLKAIEVEDMLFKELDSLTRTWYENGSLVAVDHSWKVFSKMSMRLDRVLEHLAHDLVSPMDAGELTYAFDSPSTSSKDQTSAVESSSKTSPCDTQLINGGSDAVQSRMVGKDRWLLDKKNPNPPKDSAKKPTNKKRKMAVDSSSDESPSKKRRQSWLGEEVGTAVRRMRESFFTCCLTTKQGSLSAEEAKKVEVFQNYIASFDVAKSLATPARSSKIADARHSFLEFSQFHRLEFDTLRKAKYSTSIILYHLHHNDAPGTIPVCTDCKNQIQHIRWHRVNKVIELKRKPVGRTPACRKPCPTSFEPQELCAKCHAKNPKPDDFIPLQVSFRK